MSAGDLTAHAEPDLIAQRLAALPVPIYGASLALSGICLVLPWSWPSAMPPGLLVLLKLAAAGTLALALMLHTAKALWARQALSQDIAHIGVGPFFGQIGIALCLLCEVLADTAPQAAELAFLIGIVWAGLSMGHAAWLLAIHQPSWREASPSWLLPAIQWLYLGLLASSHHAATLQTPALITGGVLASLAYLCLAMRAWRGPAWPTPVRPALAIGLVPPALGLMAALQWGAPPTSPVCLGLLTLTLLSYGYALAFIPHARHQPFRVSWWAYGMPLSAVAMALQALSNAWPSSALLLGLAPASAVLAAVLTLALCLVGLHAAHAFFFPPPSR